ncbi:MAG: thioredoxin domain-containing protein [Candidatus Latescibacterota bacterium]|nr:thioredoxin domain-containing protein [Candidatus Latescibacterota bacterium]
MSTSSPRSSQGSTNRLAAETSPYLRQHAGNPVDWYPWGKEAFALARESDRPILLSVGYSACHWCHVMERESFENELIAGIMNERFVNVKVDREERPEVDEIYMAAVQAMTGSGGWPMTVFVTPDLQPFYGGTYFPPEDRDGRPGFLKILHAVSDHYREEPDRIVEQTKRIQEFLEQNADPLRGERIPNETRTLDGAYRVLTDSFDSRYGGFSGTGPKFPPSASLTLLLRYSQESGVADALEMVELTLRKMAEGDMYDQLGGGFHRYSVDERWLVPHFEKMLYDNALLVLVYLEAAQTTGDSFYRRVARETLNYVVREMERPDGGYSAAQDADSEGEEGLFFVWTPEQVEEAINDEHQAHLLCRYYDVTPHGNYEGGTSVLHVKGSVSEVARKLGVDAAELAEAVSAGRAKLLARRAERIAPDRDDKIVVAWNGFMISAMARGFQVLGDRCFLLSAQRAARFITKSLLADDGELQHRWMPGAPPLPGQQDDYAAVACGLVDLYEADGDTSWLQGAVGVTESMLERFWDEERGAFYYTEAEREDLIVRSKNPLDSATPSGNSLATLALLRLHHLTGRAIYRQRAEQVLALYAELMESSPDAVSLMVTALHLAQRAPTEVTILGENEDEVEDLRREVNAVFLPRRALTLQYGRPDDETFKLLPALRRRDFVEGDTVAYVCHDAECSLPQREPAKLRGLLQQVARR